MRREAATLEGSWSRAPLASRLIREALPKGTDRTCFCPLLRPSSAAHPHLGPILQVPGGPSTSYPSLLSHLTSMYLSAPELALPVARRRLPGPGLRSFHPLASSLPCDFHLLNLRALQAQVRTALLCTCRPGPWPLLTHLLPIPALPHLWAEGPPPTALVRLSSRTIARPLQKLRSSYTARVSTVALRPRTWASTAPRAKAR